METKLDGLIQQIKQEGVEEAEKQAGRIIEDAREKADAIIKEARREKDNIIQEGRKEAQALRKNAEEAIKQAGRDTVLSLRERIALLFDSVTKRQVSKQLSPETLKLLIQKLIENFRKEASLDIEVLLSEQDKKELEETLFKSLSEELRKGLTLKAAPNLEKGFRIGRKDKNFYYDFTDEAISEAFRLYLNPKIADMLKIKNGQ